MKLIVVKIDEEQDKDIITALSTIEKGAWSYVIKEAFREWFQRRSRDEYRTIRNVGKNEVQNIETEKIKESQIDKVDVEKKVFSMF
jgi:lysine/ornithine N-monooxygenase